MLGAHACWAWSIAKLTGPIIGKRTKRRCNIIRRLCQSITVAAGLLLVFSAARSPVSAAEFYKGKTIRFIVGFAAGGGYDAYTRMVARYISRYIPDHPSTVVENMDGAGSVIFGVSVVASRTKLNSSTASGLVRLSLRLT